MDILLAPSECDKLLPIKLPQPNDGKLKQFLYDEENIKLYEVTKYSDHHKSWFLDNQFCKEGHFNILSRVDPLFLIIPQLRKYANSQFRTLYDICSTYNDDCSTTNNEASDKLDYVLAPDIDWNLICETKELDNEILVRFSEAKTIDWLVKKHEKTYQAIKGELCDQEPSVATLISYATDLISNYISPDLVDKLKNSIKSKYTLTDRSHTSVGEKQKRSNDNSPLKKFFTQFRR